MTKQNKIIAENTALRVGYVSPGWPLSHYPNGVIAYIQNILDGMNNDIDPVIFTKKIREKSDRPEIIDLSSILVSRSTLEKILDKTLLGIKSPFIQSIRYQRENAYFTQSLGLAINQLETPIDIIEMEESFGFANSLIKICKVPVVTRLHGPWSIIGPVMQLDKSSDFNFRVLNEGKAIEQSQGVTSPSKDVLEKVREKYNIELPNAQVIPNPVQVVSPEMQWQYDPNKTPSILFVGRFDSVKGGDLMLDAFRLIALKNKDIELSFVGPDKGITLRGELISFNKYIEQFIPEDIVKKRIHFLGHLDHFSISALRKNSLITVFSSRYENFPISLLEALSTGCPTVAISAGGIKEIIRNEYNGLLVDTQSPECIADKVLSLMDNPEKMQFLSKNAIEDCKKRFSPQVVAKQTVNYYRTVLSMV